MKPKQLEIFVEAANQLSIRAAARQLGVSQPAVTKTVRDLETELGVPLVERSARGIRLTSYGEAFLPRARLLLADIRRTREELIQMRDGTFGTVAVGINASAAVAILPTAFSAFRAAAPMAFPRISEGLVRQLLAGLLDGSYDFVVAAMSAVTTGPSDFDPRFTYTELFTTRFIVGGRQGHPLVRCRSLRSLLDAEWLVPPGLTSASGSSGYMPTIFSAFGLPPPARIVEGLSLTIGLALMKHTDMIGLLFESHAKTNLDGSGIRRIPVREHFPDVKVYAIRRREEPLTPAARQFFACFMAAAKAFREG